MAKPKRKPKPSRDKKQVDANESDLKVVPAKKTDPNEPPRLMAPVTPRPWAFRISLVLFVGWLLFLAYLAYQVST